MAIHKGVLVNKDKIEMLAKFLHSNRQNQNKKLLLEYMQELICKYSCQENTPAEQIKGMNRLMRDVSRLDDEVFEN